jgi:CRP-like cAMP-binding protein
VAAGGIPSRGGEDEDDAVMKARRDVRVEHLRRLPLFEGCSEHDLLRIARSADEIAVPPGYVLVHEGDWGDEVFIILDGEASVDVEARPVAVLGPEDVVGEVVATDEDLRAASVVAATAMRLFVLESDSFAGLLASFPLVARRVTDGMTHRLRAAQATPA